MRDAEEAEQSAGPTPLSSMNGYTSTAASCAARRIAEGSFRASLSTGSR